jgi:transcriptional regulator with PAS, ATPase and Fis domain
MGGLRMGSESNELFVDGMKGWFENPYVGIMMVDTKGYIRIINQTYLDVLGLQEENVLGKHVLDITPQSRLIKVLKSEKVDLGDYFLANGYDTIAFRTPIYKNGVLIGAMGQSLALGRESIKQLYRKLSEVEGELTAYKNMVKSIYSSKYCFESIMSKNAQLIKLKSLAKRAAHNNSTILIIGESGTGKDLFAHAIHQASPRTDYPFVRVNCAALPDNLLESELFGYEEGAFTGAKKGGKPGKFELANQGIIFLDEIGDMPMTMQSKILTVLQDREVERVGGTKPIRIDVQVIAATNRNLEDMIKKGKFRKDLYFRLNVVIIDIPPLRKRTEDIPLLIEHLISKIDLRLKTGIDKVSEESVKLLCSYNWPGNVRELENLLERAMNLAELNQETVLTSKHFPSLSELGIRPVTGIEGVENLGKAVEKVEKEMIKRCLQQTRR